MVTRQLFVTGFGPFADVAFNPSGAIARALSEQPPRGWNVRHVELPVTFAGAPQAIDHALSQLSARPDFLLGLGVHRGRTFRFEQRARAHAIGLTRPDNDGETGDAVTDHDSRERVTSIELRAQALALMHAGAGAVTISNEAGQYVCERAYHGLLTRASSLGVPALFLHVPPEHALSHVAQTEIVRAWLSALDLSPLLTA